MFRWLTRLLGNASVTLKLALGFGQVLILSVLIAATGWQALNAVLYRSNSLTTLAQLALDAETMRADRIVYRTLTDPERNRQHYVAPSSALELSLVSVWCEVLNRSRGLK